MKNSRSTRTNFAEPSGAKSLLGLDNQSAADPKATIERGIPFEALESLASSSGLSIHDLTEALGLHSAKLTGRDTKGKFTSAESEHLLLLAGAIYSALDLFSGKKEKVARWFATPSPALGDQTPLQIARTIGGCRSVETLTGRLKHGVFT